MTQIPLLPPPFPAAEFHSRLKALRTAMAARQVDLLIVNQFEHIGYFGGYWSTGSMYHAFLIPIDGEPVAILRALDAPIFRELSCFTEYVAFNDSANPLKTVAQTILAKGYGAAAIGLEYDSNFLTVNRARELESLLPNARMVDFSHIMWEMRQVKSPLELVYLEAAAEICDRAVKAAFDVAQPGINEREVFTAMTGEAWRSGADNGAVAVMTSGPRSSMLHASLGHRTLAEGDIVHVEPIPRFRGYSSRMQRPKSIGAPTDEQMRTAETMIRIQDEQYRAMKPGAEAKEVDRILREGILAAGLRDSYTGITGYTLGFVSAPRLSDFTRVFLPDSAWQLKKNQVFHMYTSARGMSFSETIVVTPEGGERLTKMDRRLFY
ncbi:M24 family metallopeptidase [Bradyrhizobium arachidis]|uniref:Aminopeptidase P family protein n=1 Tax=Bradyrhizobium arachidis TaxID=858423 RepID=A0AAE7NIJ0_9BRAD|nr:Xaa-Pro peptidase family protein [Bradyrhizobium arachidis]QOZ66629.1 aminopeptidase P family protein [Bradyrhizobium arachidis]SFV17420.1 Xaa-Pro dipeptidase [Bradyrhizobium arachidis]